MKASERRQHTPLRVIVKLTNAPEVRFSATLGHEGEVEVASLAPTCDSRFTKLPELSFHAILSGGAQEMQLQAGETLSKSRSGVCR